MAILILILRLPVPRIEVPHLSATGLTRFILIASLAVLWLHRRGLRCPPAAEPRQRLQHPRNLFQRVGRSNCRWGLLVPWAGDVFNPALMTIGMARRRLGLLMLGGFGQLLIYADTGYKNVLFAVALVPLVYFAVANASRWFGLAAGVGSSVILLGSVPLSAVTGNWSVTLTRRIFATPGQVAYYFYEYFSVHPKDHLSHSFLRYFIHSAYAQPPPLVIGAAYFPASLPDANGHMWADAFGNFGFAGIIIFTVICGLILWVADGLGRRRDARLAAPMLVIAGLTLASSALFTSMLTLGVGLAFVVMALMPPISGREATSPVLVPGLIAKRTAAIRAARAHPRLWVGSGEVARGSADASVPMGRGSGRRQYRCRSLEFQLVRSDSPSLTRSQACAPGPQ